MTSSMPEKCKKCAWYVPLGYRPLAKIQVEGRCALIDELADYEDGCVNFSEFVLKEGG